jgi:hypothetical protein
MTHSFHSRNAHPHTEDSLTFGCCPGFSYTADMAGLRGHGPDEFNSTLTLSLATLATARSGLPSPLKSALVTD